MVITPKVYPQFSTLIDRLAAHARAHADSCKNASQGSWLALYASQNTRRELLADLDRVDLNEEFKQLSESANENEMVAAAVAELQHDFLAAVARDLFVVRSPRLGRLFRYGTIANGMADDSGVFRSVILRYIENLVNRGNAELRETDPGGELTYDVEHD